MSQYFPACTTHSENIKVELDLSNYATKSDLKNATHIDTSNLATKSNLFNLKTKVHKLDIDKLVPIPNDLAKLSNGVKNDVIKKNNLMLQKQKLMA